jgi:5-methylcytosine-specific restriction endonuclease McrA
MKLKQTASELKESQLDSRGFLFCQKCFRSDKSLEVHHIVYRSEAPKHINLHHSNNLTLICNDCHRWYHSKKSNRKQIVEKRKLWEQFPLLLNKYK